MNRYQVIKKDGEYYIIDTEAPINTGDWFLSTNIIIYPEPCMLRKGCNTKEKTKIIATTNKELNDKHNIPTIPDDFVVDLQYNPNIEILEYTSNIIAYTVNNKQYILPITKEGFLLSFNSFLTERKYGLCYLGDNPFTTQYHNKEKMLMSFLKYIGLDEWDNLVEAAEWFESLPNMKDIGKKEQILPFPNTKEKFLSHYADYLYEKGEEEYIGYNPFMFDTERVTQYVEHLGLTFKEGESLFKSLTPYSDYDKDISNLPLSKKAFDYEFNKFLSQTVKEECTVDNPFEDTLPTSISRALNDYIKSLFGDSIDTTLFAKEWFNNLPACSENSRKILLDKFFNTEYMQELLKPITTYFPTTKEEFVNDFNAYLARKGLPKYHGVNPFKSKSNVYHVADFISRYGMPLQECESKYQSLPYYDNYKFEWFAGNPTTQKALYTKFIEYLEVECDIEWTYEHKDIFAVLNDVRILNEMVFYYASNNGNVPVDLGTVAYQFYKSTGEYKAPSNPYFNTILSFLGFNTWYDYKEKSVIEEAREAYDDFLNMPQIKALFVK